MSQYSQRYWQYSLIAIITLLVGCSRPAELVTTTVEPSDIVDISDGESRDSSPSLDSQANSDSASGGSFDEIYSSFAEEMKPPEELEAELAASQLPPLEYLYEIAGGNDAMLSDVPTWVTGERFMHFVEPKAFYVDGKTIFILDSGRQALFQYLPDGKKLITKLNLRTYLRGYPSGLVFNDAGYYFISEGISSRILKFSPENKLIAVYKDKANLAQPGKLFFDEKHQKLFVVDEVYSRILIISKLGEFMYTVGARGSEKGAFIKITDFLPTPEGLYVADRIGAPPLQRLSDDGEYIDDIGRNQLSIPSAVAYDEYGRLYVADQSSDTIKIFIDGVMRWELGGPGTKPGKFREVTQMTITDGKLYILDSLNRRIQVFKING